ncbi:cytochrome P450 2D18 [Jackrogersella minutella]|nr:cytochrome P450 2D18 [Jackrogersella minutella]
MYLIILASTLLFAFAISAATLSWPGSRGKSLPPGPPTLPFLGNMHLMPRTGIHLKYTTWAQTYGSIFSLKIGQWTMIVLNSASNASRLLDQRSSLYSDRPPSHAIGDLVFQGHHPMFMSANDRWKLRRKLYHQMFQESRCNKQHVKLIEAESAQLIHDMCVKPEDLMLQPGRFSNSIVMSLVFGIRTPSYDTPHYLKLREVLEDLSLLGEVGATPPVDILPMLKYFPEWLWGNWKTRARLLRQKVFDLYNPLVDRVIERRAMGKTLNSFLDGVLDQKSDLGLNRDEINIMCGNLLEGGTDTMATLILTLCQAMALHPAIQDEAHAHIDSVLDDSRLPTWADYESLPYVAMLVKEVHRWRPPGPGGFPHALNKEDEIDGLKLPKDSMIVINIWGIHHDPDRYKDPEVFDPSRFEGQTQLASVYANSGNFETRDHYGYGIGRRICPGIHMAERGLWLAIARILWSFKIRPKLDGAGNPIPINVSPESGYSQGFLAHCLPFEVDIKVRSEKRKQIIMGEAAKAEANVFRGFS